MTGQEKTHERVNQKRRTRAELLRAARALAEKGGQPSVADAADHAGISRATAYRYFSTPDDMLREALLDAVATGISLDIAGVAGKPMSAEERICEVVRQVFVMVEENEVMFRALLASSATGKSQVKRGARRLGWIADALQPLEGKVAKQDLEGLTLALGLLTGIETFVVFKDICGLSTRQAEDAALWTAKTLLAGVLSRQKAG